MLSVAPQHSARLTSYSVKFVLLAVGVLPAGTLRSDAHQNPTVYIKTGHQVACQAPDQFLLQYSVGWGLVESLGYSAANGSSVHALADDAANDIPYSYWPRPHIHGIRRCSTDKAYEVYVILLLHPAQGMDITRVWVPYL